MALHVGGTISSILTVGRREQMGRHAYFKNTATGVGQDLLQNVLRIRMDSGEAIQPLNKRERRRLIKTTQTVGSLIHALCTHFSVLSHPTYYPPPTLSLLFPQLTIPLRGSRSGPY